MITALLVVWFTVLVGFYYFKKIELLRKGSKLPSPAQCYPLVGHAHLFIGQPEKIFQLASVINEKFKRLVAIWLGPSLNVLIYDPKDVEIVLKASREMKKADQYEFLRPWLGDSILLSYGNKFRQNKKILVQSFHVNNLRNYLGIMNDQAQAMVERLRIEIGHGEFDIHTYLSLSTMHAFLQSSLGLDQETMSPDEALNYARAVEKVGRLIHMRVYKVWLYPKIFFRFSSLKKEQDKYIDILNTLTYRVISKKKAEYESRLKSGVTEKCNTFVDNFFEARKDNGEELTAVEIKDEVMTMMFAGQDTTTVSLGFALSLLGVYKECQEKVFNEIHSIFGDSTRPVTFEDTQKMKYMEQVIQETWRLYPPIPLIARTPLEDVQLDGYVLPKNCTIAIILMMLHRNSSIYPHPHRFNPDNFLPERIKERHPYSFIPFSSNYRACIGPRYAMMVIKVFLSAILRKYEVHSDRKMKDFVLAGQTTLKRKEGFLISLKPRPIGE